MQCLFQISHCTWLLCSGRSVSAPSDGCSRFAASGDVLLSQPPSTSCDVSCSSSASSPELTCPLLLELRSGCRPSSALPGASGRLPLLTAPSELLTAFTCGSCASASVLLLSPAGPAFEAASSPMPAGTSAAVPGAEVCASATPEPDAPKNGGSGAVGLGCRWNRPRSVDATLPPPSAFAAASVPRSCEPSCEPAAPNRPDQARRRDPGGCCWPVLPRWC